MLNAESAMMIFRSDERQSQSSALTSAFDIYLSNVPRAIWGIWRKMRVDGLAI